MKINYNNIDLKIIDRNCKYNCLSCVFNHNPHISYCTSFCTPTKIWIKDIFNSDIFRL